MNYNLEGISKDEGKNYIIEKLKGAGCNQVVFEDAAIEAILNAADGTPRLINKYCNASMLIGDSNKANLITTDIVMQALNDCELGWPLIPHSLYLDEEFLICIISEK